MSGYGGGSWWSNGAGINPTLNTWTHVVTVYEGGVQIKVYVNGSLMATEAQTLNINHTTSFDIGRAYPNSYDRYFDGFIDELAIYNTALDATTISNHYNSN